MKNNRAIRLYSTDFYDFNTGKYEIYLSGCTLKCKGCHNAPLQDFNSGNLLSDKLDLIKEELQSNLIKRIWILGGEPLDQNLEELAEFLKLLKEWRQDLQIIFLTGYDYKTAIDRIKDTDIITTIDFLKVNAFDETVKTYKYYKEIHDKILSNQELYENYLYSKFVLIKGEEINE